MRFGSLFSGIGGLDLGLERAGMKCAWQVEIDPYAQKVLAKHWPDVPRYGDIRGVHSWRVAHWEAERNYDHCSECVIPVDLICGGFPCQDISVAGKGAGLAGARSGLWKEYARIVGEVRPAWVLIENVPALRTRGLRTVLGDLHALGFDAEWDGVSAASVGAPHRRDRLFVVAHARGVPVRVEQGRGRGTDGTGAAVSGRDGIAGPMADSDGQRELQPGGSVSEERGRASDGCQHMAYSDVPRLEKRIFQLARHEQPAVERGRSSTDPWAVEPDVGRVAHGVPARVDRLKCLGNAVVPQVAEHVGRLIMAAAR